MSDVKLSRALCKVVGEALRGSHKTLESLFIEAGVPGDPPDLSHAEKWKTWLFRAGQDPTVDSLKTLGNIIEEFMDVPTSDDQFNGTTWAEARERVVEALERDGLRYYRGGVILPVGASPRMQAEHSLADFSEPSPRLPESVQDVLTVIIRNLSRAMYPLANRRKSLPALSFSSEYDVQDLLHALLRPWVADIRPEEYTPSYAGRSTRMDFLLPAHDLVIEVKYVRDAAHARNVGQELIVDIEHYRRHSACKHLWCVIYDKDQHIPNPAGMKSDLDGTRSSKGATVEVHVWIVGNQAHS